MACDSANSGASMVRIKEITGTGLERKGSDMLAKRIISDKTFDYV